MFGFVGPNGAGKTTAMRIAIGVLAADAGQVRWAGAPVDAEIRRGFGYMPEERGLYPKMRAAEQLAYLAELRGVAEADAAGAAARWIECLGLAERADEAVEKLSLGNQQRVQLGAALVHEPELLILDEPFSGLDPVGVDVLSEVLLGVARERGVPVVFSSHQRELVERLCDAVAIVNHGRLVAVRPRSRSFAPKRAGGRWRVEVRGADRDWAAPGRRATESATTCSSSTKGPIRRPCLMPPGMPGSVTRFGAEMPTPGGALSRRGAVARRRGTGGDRR